MRLSQKQRLLIIARFNPKKYIFVACISIVLSH